MRLLFSIVFISLLVAVNIAHAGGLPPDPGKAGMRTLAGIDSDHDGVRDDVQRWIAFTFPDSEKTRAALRQDAMAMQQLLLDAADPIRSYNNALLEGKAIDCLSYIRDDFAVLMDELKEIVLNTYMRSKAWLQADRHLSGQMFKGLDYKNWKQGCDFDPDAMLD